MLPVGSFFVLCMNCDASEPSHTTEKHLSQAVWQARVIEHRERAQEWTLRTLDRRSRQIVHPVEDFLFTYYPSWIHKVSATPESLQVGRFEMLL